jgi:hypothetical protein
MELPRQHNKCHEGQQRHRHECVDARLPAEDGGGGWSLHCLVEQRHWAVEHPEGDENSDSEERHQFDDRFRGDRQHQAILVLGRIDMTGPEQHGERGHRKCDEKRDVTKQRPGDIRCRCDVGKDGFQR